MKVRHMLLGVVAVVLAGLLVTVPAVRTPPAQAATKPYIPLISKGFQHQFWQAVKQGAEQAAKDFNVTITFEGPESESQVDKQIEMLQAALDKKRSEEHTSELQSLAYIVCRLLLEKKK